MCVVVACSSYRQSQGVIGKPQKNSFMIEKIPSSRQVSWDLYIGVQGYSSVREKSFSQWGSSKGLQVRTSSIQDELMDSPPSQSS